LESDKTAKEANTMRTQITLSLLALMALFVSACSNATPAPILPTDPVTVVQEFYAAVNAQDKDKAALFVAYNAVVADPLGTWSGKDQFLGHYMALVKSGITFEVHNLKDTNGRVTYGYVVYENGRILDAGRDGVAIVENGKIVFDGGESTAPY
jgi:hypothetical protein